MAGQPPASQYAASDCLLAVCCGLSVLQAVHEVAPESLVTAHMTPLVKLLNRCAREVCATVMAGQMHQQHYQMVARQNK